MFKCKNCGGKVIFDIPTQRLKCQYCDSVFSVSDYSENNDADTYETNVYICQSCGAELVSPDEQIMSYCSYCGSEAMLPGKTTKETAPKAIIPFRIAKDQCKNIYKNKFHGIWYLPKDFKDAQLIDSMRGIYIPFWSCSMNFPEHAYIKATRDESISSEKYYHTTYSVDVSAVHNKARYQVDASSALDDTITDKLTPYPDDKMRPFKAPYLAGFYADRADVPVTKYIPYLKQQATNDVLTATRKELSARSMSLEAGQEEIFKKTYQPQPRDYYPALLPVWFLTHREKNRVSYAVVNGYDGKMYADMPVDSKQFWLVTAIIAVVLFVGLSLFTSLIAKTALGIAALITGIVSLIFRGQLKQLADRESHAYDIGSPFYDGVLRDSTGKTVSPKASSVFAKVGKVFFYIFVFMVASGGGLGILLELISSSSQNTVMNLLLIVGMVLSLISMIGGLKHIKKVIDKSLILSVLLPFITVAVSLVIGVLHPVDDWWYYLGAILCIVGALIPCIQLIRCYNENASRPLPSYFAREGGLNDAK